MLITKKAFDGVQESRSQRLAVNIWREFPLRGHILTDGVQEFDQFQKARGDHDQMPIAANPAAFKQEQRPQRTVPFQKGKHHVYDNLQLVGRGRYSLRSQPDGRVDLLPSVLKDRLQDAQLAVEVLDQLRLSGARWPADLRKRNAPVSRIGQLILLSL